MEITNINTQAKAIYDNLYNRATASGAGAMSTADIAVIKAACIEAAGKMMQAQIATTNFKAMFPITHEVS